jgi:hypothetical protein
MQDITPNDEMPSLSCCASNPFTTGGTGAGIVESKKKKLSELRSESGISDSDKCVCAVCVDLKASAAAVDVTARTGVRFLLVLCSIYGLAGLRMYCGIMGRCAPAR